MLFPPVIRICGGSRAPSAQVIASGARASSPETTIVDNPNFLSAGWVADIVLNLSEAGSVDGGGVDIIAGTAGPDEPFQPQIRNSFGRAKFNETLRCIHELRTNHATAAVQALENRFVHSASTKLSAATNSAVRPD